MNIEDVDYTTKIPNNVNLAEDRQVLRALESWHPGYIDWWMDMGPEGFQQALVYLRTAVSVDPKAIITASKPGRTCPANIAPCCAASW
jgi:benzoyl-CoA 2,3-dioxygenase component B